MISLSQRPLPDNTQHSQETDIHVLGRIGTRNSSKKAAAYPHLIMRGMNNNNNGNCFVQIYVFKNYNVKFLTNGSSIRDKSLSISATISYSRYTKLRIFI